MYSVQCHSWRLVTFVLRRLINTLTYLLTYSDILYTLVKIFPISVMDKKYVTLVFVHSSMYRCLKTETMI